MSKQFIFRETLQKIDRTFFSFFNVFLSSRKWYFIQFLSTQNDFEKWHTSCFKVTISSLDDLAKQTDTKYSVVKGSDTETYFKHMAKIEETFYNNWKTMSLGSTSPNTADKSSQYAVWDYPLGDKFTIIWNRMKETGLLNSSVEGVQKVSHLLHFVSLVSSEETVSDAI